MEETDPMFANQPISPTHDIASCDIATTTASNPNNVNNSNGTSQPTREIKQERIDDHNTYTNRNEKTNSHQVYKNSYTPSSNAPKERAVDWRGKTSSVQTPISN